MLDRAPDAPTQRLKKPYKLQRAQPQMVHVLQEIQKRQRQEGKACDDLRHHILSRSKKKQEMMSQSK